MDDERQRLRAAYEATDYRVDGGARGSFVIRSGARSAELDALLDASAADGWAFITASNPRSVRLGDADNARRMDALRARVRALGLPHFPGAGVAIGGDWPAEPSLLVVGIAEADAVALAREFEQHAIVAGRRGGPARLVWVEADAAADPGGHPQSAG